MAPRDAYNLDNVANVECDGMSDIVFPRNKGDVGMDNVISVDTDASLRYQPDRVFPLGESTKLDATTDLPMGTGARAEYAGDTGVVAKWPKAFE